MTVSQTAEYALRAVVCLARHKEPQNTQHIAECTRVPQSYLPKVLQPLARANLVNAQRGVRGGYTLERSSKEMTVLDVVNCVDPIRRTTTCPGAEEDEAAGICPLHDMLDHAVGLVENEFAKTTIHQLAYLADGRPAKCHARVAVRVTSKAAEFAVDTPRNGAI